MKQTIFNASLEESMNLVTDKYIQTSMENVKEHGVWKKIIGFLTLFGIICLTHLLILVKEFSIHTFFHIPVSMFSKLILFLSLLTIVLYIISVIKNNTLKVYQYTVYGLYIYSLVLLYLFQGLAILIAISEITLGETLSIILYGSLLILIAIDRYRWFEDYIKGKLYQKSSSQNKFYEVIDKFSIFSKRYGGLLLLVIFLVKFFFSNTKSNNDIIRFIGLSFSPFLLLIALFFTVSMLAEHFQGYYLKKYSEDYRQMSGYSIEEWYGKKSKMYRDSMK